jgi:hypothetical protein
MSFLTSLSGNNPEDFDVGGIDCEGRQRFASSLTLFTVSNREVRLLAPAIRVKRFSAWSRFSISVVTSDDRTRTGDASIMGVRSENQWNVGSR